MEKNTVGNASSILDLTTLNYMLEQIREEFDDHLEAINENTNEIQSNASSLAEIDAKLNKVAERIERIELFLQKSQSFTVPEMPKFDIKALTEREKSIFLILYTLDYENRPMTYRELQKRAGLPMTLLQGYITSLIEKGIPIAKKYINNVIHLKLDEQFRALQAKTNIVKLEQQTLNHIL